MSCIDIVVTIVIDCRLLLLLVLIVIIVIFTTAGTIITIITQGRSRSVKTAWHFGADPGLKDLMCCFAYSGYMGGCQNYGPFLGTLNIKRCRRDPKRDHNFDNRPYGENGKENQNYYNGGIQGFGLYGDNGKENRNCYIIIGYILGLYKDNGKPNGNYYLLFDFGKGGMMLRFSHQPLW